MDVVDDVGAGAPDVGGGVATGCVVAGTVELTVVGRSGGGTSSDPEHPAEARATDTMTVTTLPRRARTPRTATSEDVGDDGDRGGRRSGQRSDQCDPLRARPWCVDLVPLVVGTDRIDVADLRQ